MKNLEVLNEIDGFEKKSNFSNRLTILFYTFLKFVNSETIYLLISLASTFFSCYIFDFSYLLGFTAHFIVWVSFRNKIIDREKLKNENSQIDLIINTIKNHIKEKSEK